MIPNGESASLRAAWLDLSRAKSRDPSRSSTWRCPQKFQRRVHARWTERRIRFLFSPSHGPFSSRRLSL